MFGVRVFLKKAAIIYNNKQVVNNLHILSSCSRLLSYSNTVRAVYEMPPKRKREVKPKTEDEDSGTSKSSTSNIKGKGQSDDKSQSDPKIRKTRNAKKPQPQSDSESEPEDQPAKKKTVKSKGEVKPKTAPMNKTDTAHDSIDYSCTKKNLEGKEFNIKISSWNVDGLRAWLKKGGLEFFTRENPDFICLQETKCSEDKLPLEIKTIEDYEVHWATSDKDGYAGVGLLSKQKPLSVKYGLGESEHDNEGRIITAEFEKFFLISVYVPNAGRGLVTLPKRLKWNEAFRKFIKDLDQKKPVIVCGDMNVAHTEIDLANPKTNTKNAGFTKEERDGMTEFLSDGYVDTFRKLYPDETGAYTFWTYMGNARSRNVGWRLDYFIVSERLANSICDNVIRKDVYGSDHCPLTLFLHV